MRLKRLKLPSVHHVQCTSSSSSAAAASRSSCVSLPYGASPRSARPHWVDNGPIRTPLISQSPSFPQKARSKHLRRTLISPPKRHPRLLHLGLRCCCSRCHFSLPLACRFKVAVEIANRALNVNPSLRSPRLRDGSKFLGSLGHPVLNVACIIPLNRHLHLLLFSWHSNDDYEASASWAHTRRTPRRKRKGTKWDIPHARGSEHHGLGSTQPCHGLHGG